MPGKNQYTILPWHFLSILLRCRQCRRRAAGGRLFKKLRVSWI